MLISSKQAEIEVNELILHTYVSERRPCCWLEIKCHIMRIFGVQGLI